MNRDTLHNHPDGPCGPGCASKGDVYIEPPVELEPIHVCFVCAQRIAALEARVAEHLRLMRHLEKFLREELDFCPICDCHSGRGHADGCSLAAALSPAPADEEEKP